MEALGWLGPITVTRANSPYSVSAGVVAANDLVLSGGSMFVLAGASASATMVEPGGLLTVKVGGVASATSILAGEPRS